jgi:DNA-binding IclR family transcriptional regulator
MDEPGERKSGTTPGTGPRLIERAIDVLMVLSSGPKTFTGVCRGVGLSKGTVHRILTGLSYADFVVQNPATGEYMLGSGCYRMVRELGGTNGGVAGLVRPVLADLCAQTGETVVLHIRVGRRRVCIEEFESPQSLRYTAGVGTSAPLHVGSAGKVLLAWLEEKELRALLPDQLERLTEATITDWPVLLDELGTVRSQGWAESHGERVGGAFAVSAPVFDDRAQVVACVSVLGPEARLTRSRFIELRRATVAAAAGAGAMIGAPQRDGTESERDAVLES